MDDFLPQYTSLLRKLILDCIKIRETHDGMEKCLRRILPGVVSERDHPWGGH